MHPWWIEDRPESTLVEQLAKALSQGDIEVVRRVRSAQRDAENEERSP